MKFRLIIFLICYFSLLEVCLAQSTIIDLDKNSTPFTNISEIAEELRPITFQVDDMHSFGIISEVLFLENTIALSVRNISAGNIVSKALQFDIEGNFIKQIGKKYKGFISLSYDPDRKEIGISDQKTIMFYSETGVHKRSIEVLQFHQTYFDDSYWLVEMEAKKGENYKYDLVKFDPLGKNRKIVLSYNNPPMMLVGIFPTYSLVDETFYLSTNVDGSVYSLEEKRAKLAFELRSKISAYGITTLLKDWITTSTRDSRRSGRILHFYNLRENKNYTARSSYQAGIPGSTIKNDFMDNGLIRPFEGTILGYPNQKAFCFVNAFANDSKTSHTIYIAILK